MQIKDIIEILESFAPLVLQEAYDNSGLIIGNPESPVRAALLCIDVTEEVIEEAKSLDANLIIAHHPLIFSGLKKINGKDMVQRCVIQAVKHDIAIYAAHTNMDNVIDGVNGKIADKIGLINRRVLQNAPSNLVKLITFVPKLHVQRVREAIFAVGGGNIGNYDACSFNAEGYGSFRPNDEAKPFVGELHKIHYEDETKIEIILPTYLQAKALAALLAAHPYEEPAYDIIPLLNAHPRIGAGLIGELQNPENEKAFLQKVKTLFGGNPIKHTAFLNKEIKKVALCGGSGSFLLDKAIAAGADIFISGDIKYHDYFKAEQQIIIADVGHYESEQFTKEVFYELIQKKLPTFALHISKINTNPIFYS